MHRVLEVKFQVIPFDEMLKYLGNIRHYLPYLEKIFAN